MKSIVIFLSCLVTIESANILGIFPYPYYSHQKFQHALIKELVGRGHKVTIFTTYPQDYGNNLNVTQHYFSETVKIHNQRTDMLIYKRKQQNWMKKLLQHETPAYFESAMAEMEHPEMQKLIHNSSNYKFDMLITECVFCPHFLLAEIYDCPIVLTAAMEAPSILHSMMGNEVNPLKYSEVLYMPYIHGQMTLAESLHSLLFSTFYELVYNPIYFISYGYLNLKYFGHLGMKAFKPPQDRLALMMTNTNQAFGHVRPLMPNTIQIGYIHIEEPKEVKDVTLKNFLDTSDNGVIVMSLGSRADTRSLGAENVRKFMNVFNQTSMNVLWKLHGIDDDEDVDVPHNVKISKWLPLADVLAHPNVKVLIHHGGLQTCYEGIDRKVPMIIFPLAFDQYMNARLMTKNGIATEMDLNNFNEKSLRNAIQEMRKPRYIKNLRKMRSNVYDRPISSRDLAVWYVENVLRNPVSYSKDFGAVSIIDTQLFQILLYFGMFLLSFWVLRRKIIWKN